MTHLGNTQCMPLRICLCSVRGDMVAAGMAAVDVHGAGQAPVLLPLFEGYLAQRDALGDMGMEPEEEERYDLVREGEGRGTSCIHRSC